MEASEIGKWLALAMAVLGEDTFWFTGSSHQKFAYLQNKKHKFKSNITETNNFNRNYKL